MVNKRIKVLQAHYYSQQNLIVRKQLTKFATDASVTYPFCGKLI